MSNKPILVGLLCGLVMTGAAMAPSGIYAGVLEKLFAPKAKLWSNWTKHQTTSTRTIDHSNWADFLQTYVKQSLDGVNRIDYAGVSESHRVDLQAYISKMEKISISEYRRDEQFAYWVNLYNALTVKIVLEHYPVDSIRNIKLSKGLFSKGPWDKKLLSIEGEEISLNDIEHRILRPIWNDPRIHYAVNCASVGCPNLQQQAFSSDNLQELLDKAAHDYINHPRGVGLERNRLIVSSIYVWFESDFGGSGAGVISHLKQHANVPLAKALEKVKKISGDRYDWSLNDVAS